MCWAKKREEKFVVPVVVDSRTLILWQKNGRHCTSIDFHFPRSCLRNGGMGNGVCFEFCGRRRRVVDCNGAICHLGALTKGGGE